MLPAVLAVLPGFVAGLAGAGDRVGAPGRLAGVEVGRLDIAADAELAAGSADDGEVAHDQRRHGQGFAQSRIGDLAFPHHFAGRLVDGEHAAVESDRDDLVLPQRDAAVVDAAAGDVAGPGAVGAGVHLPLDRALLAGAEVDRIDRAPAIRHIHHAVLDDGRRFQIAECVTAAALEPAQRHRVGEPHVLDGIGVDFLQRREPVALVIAVMEDPVLRLALRIERAFGGHVGRAQRRQRGRHQQRTRECAGERFGAHETSPSATGSRRPAGAASARRPSERRGVVAPARSRRRGRAGTSGVTIRTRRASKRSTCS